MYLGIDFGATKVLLAVISEDGQVGETRKFATPLDYPTFLEQLQQEFDQLNITPTMAAIGAPGVIDRQTGVVTSYGNRDWRDTPLKADLEKIVGCPVLIENDGKLAGLAEALLIIDDYKKVLCLAIGTGIGIAYTANGIIDTSISDEGGHGLLLEHDGVVQPWEHFASGHAIVEKYGKMASEISDPEAWKAIAHNLFLGIFELLKTLSPDVIVISGGVGTHFDRYQHFLEAELQQGLGSRPVPALRQAQHTEQAVIYGGYELIRSARESAAS